MMKQASFLYALAFLLAHLAEPVTSDVLTDVCTGVQDLWNCKASVRVPTGAKARMCPNKFVEVRRILTVKVHCGVLVFLY